MEQMEFDLVVIGGGSAGYAAARTARESWDRVAIIDGAKKLGGLCILRGCMPSKTLLYAAEIRHFAEHAEQFGLPPMTVPPPDMGTMRNRKRRIIAEFAEYRGEQLQSPRFTLLRGNAHFTDEDTLALEDGRTVRAKAYVIATGSVVQVPPVPGLAETTFLTSDDILDLDHLPTSIITLGGGVVACELTQYLARMGCHVTMIQRSDQILRGESEPAARVIEDALREDGVTLYTGTKIESIAETNGGVAVRFQHQGKTLTANADKLFNALGREPATRHLNLEAAGVELRPSGHVQVDEMQQSTNPRIYAAGDCAGPHEIVHVAILQGETAARHATGQPAEPVNYDCLTRVVFSDPQLAYAGISEESMRERGIDWVAADFPFDDHGKSILMEAKRGHVKLWADRDKGHLIAAECVGKDAGELIHAMAVALPLRATIQDLLKAHWYHPTLSEIWTYPLEDLAEQCAQPGKADTKGQQRS